MKLPSNRGVGEMGMLRTVGVCVQVVMLVVLGAHGGIAAAAEEAPVADAAESRCLLYTSPSPRD